MESIDIDMEGDRSAEGRGEEAGDKEDVSANPRAPIIRMTMPQQNQAQDQGAGGNQPITEPVMLPSTGADGAPGGPSTALTSPPGTASAFPPVSNGPILPGRSMPVSPTFQAVRSPPVPVNSGPPTPNPQQFYQSPSNSSISATSTTSFLANQHQQHNPQSIGVAQPAATLAANQPQPINHRMALNDAFSYLDRVKSEFSNQPDVYNKFLQVMREFKANVIDANGVIIRVVHLFRGHRDLILGFNAFLPKTHHIDPIVAETGELPASITAAANQQSSGYPSIAPQRSTWQPSYTAGQPNVVRQPTNYQSGSLPGANPIASQPPTQSSNTQQPPQIPQQQPAGPGPALKKSSNAQFTRAISYVKRVKQRFSNDPDSYKTFLGALHSFHKDQRSVAEVCSQVQKLFKDHADLLEEFMQFLPESVESIRANRLPPMGQFTPQMEASNTININNSHQQMPVHSQNPPQQQQQPYPSQKRSKRQRPHPPLPSSHHQPAITKTAEEVDFFEKVKKLLGNRQVYAEFLRCLNMYSQNILKLSELIQLVSGFIGGSEELFGWFKRYIGYSAASLDALPNDHPKGMDIFIHGAHEPEMNLAACKRFGSYRLLPSNYKLSPSSGRTELCREVLNDEMISCPTFASEDSTFVSSRKNTYEEALFRCEDERFELDLLIDGNRATISCLEPLLRLYANSDVIPGDLDSKLNGTSSMIYKRTIKRVYGEKAEEVYEALQKNPSLSLPVVLKRLKQKDEEWQRARREWQRVWRDIHVRNHYRALDHQGIDFKQTDRRTCSVKQLVQELEILSEERRRSGLITKAPHLTIPLDTSVMAEAFKLLLVSLKYSGSVSSSDRKPVRSLLHRTLPLLCNFKMSNVVPGAGNQDATGSEHSEEEQPRTDSIASLERNFYLNSSLYGAVKMFATIVERLGKMKQLAAGNTPYATRGKQNVVAQMLDLTISDDPESTIEVVGGDMFFTLLKLLKKFVSNDIESALFEEQVRFMFGLEAYSVFTLDRLLHSTIRQIHSLLPSVSESNKGEQLVRLLEDTHRLPEYTCRMSAEALLSNPKDRLIRASLSHQQLNITLIDSTQLLMESVAATPEQRWSAYVDSFIRLDVNPMYADGTGNGIFLRRSMKHPSSLEPTVDYNLECKICVNTYKLFYVEHTEDFLFRPCNNPNGNITRSSKFGKWLDSRI